MVEFCESKGIPLEVFHKVVTHVVALWWATGKPAEIDFGVVKRDAEDKGTIH